MTFCTIIGNFKAFVADSADGDDLPDFVPMTGSGTIWPNITTVSNTQVGYKSTYFNSTIPVVVDADGDLSRNDVKYVKVLTDSPELNSTDFNYSILLNLAAQGESNFRQYGPFTFPVTPGGTVDLADFVPVSASSGVPMIQGPRGEPGDLVMVSSGVPWTGAMTLTGYPQTYLATLTGNVTSLTLPTSPIAQQSGTITLVLTQDATGGRTIAWPASVKWPDGIAQQPAAAANSVSVINLLWTGTSWLGMVGGKSFA